MCGLPQKRFCFCVLRNKYHKVWCYLQFSLEGRARGGGGAPRNAMDYTLDALKIFGSQLAGSTTAPSSEGSSPAQMLFGLRFQRAWIQVPVPDPASFFIGIPSSFHSPFLSRGSDDLQRQAGRDRARGLQHWRRDPVSG